QSIYLYQPPQHKNYSLSPTRRSSDLNKYISETKYIEHNQQLVYDHLSNFENLGTYLNSGLLEKITSKFPQITISEFESDRDSCRDRKSTRLNSSHVKISYAVFCLKKK